MPSFARENGQPSEHSPLLGSESNHHQHGSAITRDEVAAAEVAEQGEGGAPQFPELGKSRSYSHGQLVTPENDLRNGPDSDSLVKFKENGKLQGVSEWKFRCVFGGILLGYFVSLNHVRWAE
jgi:hypothetical protein